MPLIRGRLRRRTGKGGESPGDESGREAAEPGEVEFVAIDPGQLTGVFTVPQWLRDLGLMSWLLVGVALFVAGAVWLLSLTEVIVLPVLTAGIVAAVASPLVAWLQGRGVPRALGVIVLMLAVIGIAVGIVLLVIGGITSQSGDVSAHLSDAKDEINGWLTDLGVDPAKADQAEQDASTASTDSVSALLNGLAGGISTLSSIVFFLAMTALSLFFLLKDGPSIRSWTESHMGVPTPVAKSITQRVLESLRGYFLGVTIVAAFNAGVVALGALILGVPLIGTLAAVTFLAAYIPYIGAWTAGIFTVLIALGSGGPEAAAGMTVVELLANGVLQQVVQPLAMGAALGIHPLAVLIVTIGGGALFGAVGLILSAPLTSAVVRISADLSRARAGSPAEKSAVAGPTAAAAET